LATALALRWPQSRVWWLCVTLRTRMVLKYTEAEWRAFLDGAKKGEFDDLC
jgi:hypothetical protein